MLLLFLTASVMILNKLPMAIHIGLLICSVICFSADLHDADSETLQLKLLSYVSTHHPLLERLGYVCACVHACMHACVCACERASVW